MHWIIPNSNKMSRCQLDHCCTHIRILGQPPGHERDGVGRLLQPNLVPAVLHHRHLLQPITAQYCQLSTNHSSVSRALDQSIATSIPSHLDQQLVGHVVEEAVRGEENHVPVLHAELVLVRGLGPGHNQSEVSIAIDRDQSEVSIANDQSEVSIVSLPVSQDFALKLSGRKRELEGSVEVVLLLVRSKHVFHMNPVSNLES